MSETRLQDSVIRRLEVIGEAAGRISTQFREQHPEIPWHDMIGMRNRMIHGYDDVDIEIVWNTVQRRLPELLELMLPMELREDD